MSVVDFAFNLGESALVYYYLSIPPSLLEVCILHREDHKNEQKGIDMNDILWQEKTLEVMST